MKRLAALLLLTLAAPAAAQDRAADVAAALDREPVYVAPARERELDIAAQGRLRLRIVDRDIGRVKLAVVPGAWGSARALAEGADRDLEVRGALVVVAGRAVFVVTSHRFADQAVRRVQRAFDRGGDLEAQLRRSIDGLAEIDPGPEGDVEPAGSGEAPDPGAGLPLPDGEEIVEDVTDTIQLGFVLVFVFCGLVFAFVIFVFWRNWRRAHSLSEEELTDLRAEVEHERGLLGADIVELDAATAFGGDARAAYERALDAYERSELLLKKATTRRRVDAARALVAEGRAAAHQARVASPS